MEPFWTGVRVGGQGIKMVKRIVVFAAVVLGYVLTGMALSASQPARTSAPVAIEASVIN